MKKRILIFGATGGTGSELVKQGLEKGYRVKAFVRTPSKLKMRHKNLEVAQGDVLNYEDVLGAVQNQDIVFCTLGMPASDKTTLRTDGTSNIVKAMEASGVNRLICQTSLGYADSKEVLPWHMKYIIVPFILKNAFRDHELQEAVIKKSSLDWTIVRPGNMTNGKRTGKYQHGFEPTAKIKLKISRADVAEFMLKQAEQVEYVNDCVGISL